MLIVLRLFFDLNAVPMHKGCDTVLELAEIDHSLNRRHSPATHIQRTGTKSESFGC